jgi:uncharacterized protein YbaA (DUF1428 family)
MSIKTTLAQVVVAFESGTVNNVCGVIPPGSYHFRVAKLVDAAEHDYKDYLKQKQALFKKYGVPQTVEKDGKQVPTGNLTLIGATPENIMAFNDAMSALLDTETTIPYEPIIWSKLGDEAQKKLTVSDVRIMGPLLVEELEGAPAAASAPSPVAPNKA